MSFMGTLLAGNAPLRGRAGFELVVPTLDYQLSAQFWNGPDPALAIKVHAIVGGYAGVPAGIRPGRHAADPGDFDNGSSEQC